MAYHKYNQKIRLLFIIDFIYTLTGGTENQLKKLVNNLNPEKFDIHLLSLRNTKWIRENKPLLKCHVKTFHIDKLKNPLNIFIFFQFWLYVKRLKPDIVMTFFPLSNILGVFIARLAKVRSVISTRRDFGLWLERKDRFLLRVANLFVKRIVTNAQIIKELTSKKEHFSSSKIDVIYNGGGTAARPAGSSKKKEIINELGIPPDAFLLGTVSGLKPKKKHSTIINAFKSILDVRKDVHLIIVGDGPLRKDLEALTAKLGISDYIHFAGSQENVFPFLSIFDIAINSSANEGLSNAIMEYMANGIPCVVSRAGGNPELIDDGINGYTFELDNDRELAARILSLLENKELREEFAIIAKKKFEEQLTLNTMINNYMNYFSTFYNNYR